MHMPDEARTAHGHDVFVILQLAIGSSLRSSVVHIEINPRMTRAMIGFNIVDLYIFDDDGGGSNDAEV